MMKIFFKLLILALAFFATSSKGMEPLNPQSSAKKPEPTMLDRWNEVQRQAAIAIGAIDISHQPRLVKRLAKPEIIVKGSEIFFDGKPLRFGLPLASWKDILKRKPHCDKTGIEWCVWEDLGLEVYASAEHKFQVSTVVLMLTIPERLLHDTRTPHPDGTPDNSPKADWLVRHPFTGYLEIDGFGIDSETKFWELQSSIDTRRNLHCGLRNCEFPKGILGTSSMIALHLNGGSESATIEEIKFYEENF